MIFFRRQFSTRKCYHWNFAYFLKFCAWFIYADIPSLFTQLSQNSDEVISTFRHPTHFSLNAAQEFSPRKCDSWHVFVVSVNFTFSWKWKSHQHFRQKISLSSLSFSGFPIGFCLLLASLWHNDLLFFAGRYTQFKTKISPCSSFLNCSLMRSQLLELYF